MSNTKVVHDLIHNGDLFRIIVGEDSLVVRVYERGLNKGYELDLDQLPTMIREFIKENVE